MSKRSHSQPRKTPVTYRLSKTCYAVKAVFRVLGLNDLDDDTSSSPRTRNHGGDTQMSLMPIRIPIGRRR